MEHSSKTLKGERLKGRRELKAFDMSRYEQRHVALRLAYVGAAYHGCAWQPDTPHTVEAHLFAALEKARLVTDRQSCGFTRGGRTDKGVSALGQVLALRLRSNLRCRAPAEAKKAGEDVGS